MTMLHKIDIVTIAAAIRHFIARVIRRETSLRNCAARFQSSGNNEQQRHR
jgi:hypothetical protein